MDIRRAKFGDVISLYEIESVAFDANKYHLFNKRQLRYLVEKSKGEVWLAEVSGNICGYFVLLFKQNSCSGRLYSIAVKPDFQGVNIGKDLLNRAEECVKTRNLRFISQEIRKDHYKLLNRYLLLGYQVYGRIDNYYPDGCCCLKLIKELT